MFGLGTTEILIIVVVMVVIFGASRLPALGKSLGQGIRGFQRSVTGADGDEEAPKVEVTVDDAKRKLKA